jgi:hypothetical protein
MISNEELKEFLPMLLQNTAALEKSVIGSFANICEKENVNYILYFLNNENQLEIYTSDLSREAVNIPKEKTLIYINALLPSISDILAIYSESEEDKESFYKFFIDLLKDSFKENEVHTLMYDSENKCFATSDGASWRKEKITKFIDIEKLILNMTK